MNRKSKNRDQHARVVSNEFCQLSLTNMIKENPVVSDDYGCFLEKMTAACMSLILGFGTGMPRVLVL